MIGVDIVRNDRIKEAVERFGERFLRRVYTSRELEYCFSQRESIPCLAARWACKEAVLKAFYQKFGLLLRFKEIEVLGNRGRPARVKVLREDLRDILNSCEIIVSLSHERDYSVAVALIREKNELKT
ncbi:MAG: holo-[acyl-carrier-protein] synthase [Aquificae bacterium]|nr:holo-[acyl-carrier-protein] synthase [Aquificota bacterium]